MKRILFLDNFRTFLIFLVVLLHAGLVYEAVLENSWIVVDPVKNNSIGLIRLYLDLFIMFSIFFVAGYFMPFSLKRKTRGQVFRSKFKRIMLPWLLAVSTLIPAYKAIFLYSRGLPQEEWFTYFHFFERAGSDLTIFSNNPTQNWLWFLPVLFSFQVIYLLASRLKKYTLRISLKTGVILTLVLGTTYGMVISMNGWTGWTHTALFDFQNERLGIYFLSFLLGTLCAKLKVFDRPWSKKYYILSNVALTIAIGIYTVVALNLFFNLIDPARNYYFISPVADRLVYHTTALLSMLSILHVMLFTFRRYFNKTNPLINELNRNSYNVYIIHMIVMGIVALMLIQVPVPAMVKFFILAITTFALSNLVLYAWKTTLQKKVNVKTASTVILVTVLFGFAFSSNRTVKADKMPPSPVNAQAEQSEISLHAAVIKDDTNTVIEYIKSGSDLNIAEASGGSSPLITAALFGRTEIANLLINAGADINFTNNDGSTALHTAAFFCRADIVELLLENGVDQSIANNAGSTAQQSVEAPFEAVKGIYQYFQNTLGPLGLDLNMERIRKTRPVIAKTLSQHN
ncbi:acyltransferase family protein [Marinilabilia rubra]|nr:acyltransferase family protein [Marinilabilia rubra]